MTDHDAFPDTPAERRRPPWAEIWPRWPQSWPPRATGWRRRAEGWRGKAEDRRTDGWRGWAERGWAGVWRHGAEKRWAGGWLRAARRYRRPLLALAVFALLAEMAVAMITTAVRQTPTIDEPVYAGTAVVYLQQHSLRYNPEHPPLGKLIIGAGLAFGRPRLEPAFTGSQGDLGRRLLYESGNDPWRLMLLARLPVIVLTLLFGLVVFRFASDLAGVAGGLTGLALYAFSPDVIAHGSLATLDVPAAGFLLTSAWLLWRARGRPRLYLPLAGAALGAAVATKMSTLPAVPVLLFLAALSAWHPTVAHRHASGGDGTTATTARRLLLGTFAALGVALIAAAVAWASYLAVDPHLRWTTPASARPVHGLRALAVDWLPLPRPYRDGMRIQFAFEDATWSGFLFGRHYRGALWYYLPAALLVKTPLGMLALWLAGTARLVWLPRLRVAAAYLLLPAGVLLAAAMTGSRDLGVRYAIFIPMFLAVVAATLVAAAPGRTAGPLTTAAIGATNGTAGATRAPGPFATAGTAATTSTAATTGTTEATDTTATTGTTGTTGATDTTATTGTTGATDTVRAAAGGRRSGPATESRRRWSTPATAVRVAVAGLVAFVAVSSVRTFPYYLPYSNEAFGGPARTHLRLHDSNVDWGQDLGRLADRLRDRYQGERVWLVYKGSGVPSYYGIRAADPLAVPPEEVRGLLVVSDSSIAKASGRLALLIRTSVPVDEVGHSITIFRRSQ